MTDDTFQITGYGDFEDRASVAFDYQINGQVYSTEHFLDAYGDPTTLSANDLNNSLRDWVVKVAKPQLSPSAPDVSADLQALVESV